ncbi:MAG: MFS transporter [Chloroflexota bacterium]|nr:MAG: MFS transporter [Chloroflexota bacterium]UCF27810.1 MAG: MFS transporter [Chloroflexota bacterium]
MIKNFSAITASSYLSMLFMGVAGTLIGAASRNIGLSPFEIGLMITVQNLGFMLSVMVSGAMADTVEKPKILFLGSLILSAGFLTFYLTNLFNINLLIMFTIGVGIGTYEGVTDALLIDIHPQKESLHININHFFVTFGSILITVYLIFLQMDWRNAIIQSGVLVLILALAFGLTKLPVNRTPSEPYQERMRILTRDKVVIVFFICTALVVGVELGSIGILTTYLMEMRDFTQITSKFGLVVFLVGMALGRILVGYFSPQDKINRVLLSLLGCSVIVFSGLYFIDLRLFSYGAIFLAGLSLSAVLPLILTQAGLLYKEMAGTVLGSIKVAIPIGGILVPFLMSTLIRFSSFEVSLILFPLSVLLAFLLIYFVSPGRSKVRQPSSLD